MKKKYSDILMPGEKEIDAILKLAKEEKFDEAYNLIWKTPQPLEWVKSEKSNLVITGGDYNYNEIGLIEELGHTLFSTWEFEIISHSRIVDRSKFSSAITCELHYAFAEDCDHRCAHGIASVDSASIVHLTLADPKAYSNAKKSAARELGAFFGKNLNRAIENMEYIPVIQVDRNGSQDEGFNEKKKEILLTAKTKTHAMDLINASVYAGKLKFDPDFVNAINLLPETN